MVCNEDDELVVMAMITLSSVHCIWIMNSSVSALGVLFETEECEVLGHASCNVSSPGSAVPPNLSTPAQTSNVWGQALRFLLAT